MNSNFDCYVAVKRVRVLRTDISIVAGASILLLGLDLTNDAT